MQFTSLISKLSSFCRVPKTDLITHSKRIDLNDGDVPNGQVVPKKRDAQHPIGRKLEDNRSVNIQEWKSPGFYYFYQVEIVHCCVFVKATCSDHKHYQSHNKRRKSLQRSLMTEVSVAVHVSDVYKGRGVHSGDKIEFTYSWLALVLDLKFL